MKKVFLISFLTSILFITSFFTFSSFFGLKTKRTCRRGKSSEVTHKHKEDLTIESEPLTIKESEPQAQEPEIKKNVREKARAKVQLDAPKAVRKQKTAQSLVAPVTKLDEPQPQEPKNMHAQPVQPVPASSLSPVSVEDRAHALFERCVDSTDKSLNWVNFCNQISDILKQDAKYEGLAQAFKDIATSKSIAYITYKLWWYTDKMPPKTKALYNKFSKSQLIQLINMRIALNDKTRKP
jgi:hypothetical protein